MPLAEEPESSRGRKRPRIRGADEDDEEQAGPSQADSSAHEEYTAPVGGSPPGSPPPPVRSKRSGRIIRVPRSFADYVAHGDVSLDHVPPRLPTPSERDDRSTTPEIVERPPPDLRPHPFQTHTNKLGVFRRYTHAPTWIPKHDETPDFVLEVQPPPIRMGPIHEITRGMPFAPFPNLSVALFMATYFSGMDMKSEGHATLVAAVTQDPRFSITEMTGFNCHIENVRLDKYLQGDDHPFQLGEGWQESTVYIRLPVEGKSVDSEVNAPTLPIRGLFHRRITDIVRTVCSSKSAETFHYTSYTMHWHPDPLDPNRHERVYADTYTADAMVRIQMEVDELPRQEGDIRERIALGLMLASDSAQLTSFGTASVWPVYLMFANQSKQERTKPSCHAVHHLAYVPSLGGDFTRRYEEKTNRVPKAEVEVHCKRELMHAVWNLLLDEEFVNGLEHGLAIRCSDGTERVFFLRIITYSADYPEKVLLSTIKNLGAAPCPRCLIKKKNIPDVGTRSDVRRRRPRIDNPRRREAVEDARKAMFEKGSSITSKDVQKHLEVRSMVPTRNAFSDVQTRAGQDYHDLFVVDILHEFELGVWKSVLTHLIRMLHAIPNAGLSLIGNLDDRFYTAPTFGTSTIRRLPKKVSDLSKLTARDYEDILQCAIPAFDGLFPEEDDKQIKDLLFLLATWHAYAKLRLHTDTTLEMMDTVCTSLCQAVRDFATITCPRYATKELPKEARARVARQTDQVNRGKSRTQKKTAGNKKKQFNMETFKLHCIPDYVSMVRKYGTTDSYSTQTSELAHRLSKMWYRMSNRKRNFVNQITAKESRTRFYTAMLEEINKGPPDPVPAPQPDLDDGDTPTDPSERYYLPKAATVRDLTGWLAENQGDPALRDFRTRLIDHLYSRIKGRTYDGGEHSFSSQERDSIIIVNNRIYDHKTIRFRSTTYDVRRIEEFAKPHAHADIIVLSHEDEADGHTAFPYWHARIIGIYHFIVCEKTEGDTGLSPSSQMDVLLVRWFGFDSPDNQSGWGARRLHKVGFLPDTDEYGPAFGFLDPSQVLRMVHLIPDFNSVRTKDLLTGDSIAIDSPHLDGEYPVYYVAMFSDRDLFMRYRGGGIGHLSTRHCNKTLFADRHTFREEPQISDEDSDGEGNYDELEGDEVDNASDESIDEGNGIGEENDDMLIAAVTDLDILTAAGIDFS